VNRNFFDYGRQKRRLRGARLLQAPPSPINNTDNSAKAGGSRHGNSALFVAYGSFEDFCACYSEGTKKPRQPEAETRPSGALKTGLTHTTTAAARYNTRAQPSS
jgi:hypothetical protein